MNAETGEYQLKGVAYAGNNMRENKRHSNTKKRDGRRKMKSPYGKYMKLSKLFRYKLGSNYPKPPPGPPPEYHRKPKGINLITGRLIYSNIMPLKQPPEPPSSSPRTIRQLRLTMDEVHEIIKTNR